MQPHSASLRGWHGWTAGRLAGLRFLASPVCGVWAGESKQASLSAVSHSAALVDGRRGPTPRVPARDDLCLRVCADSHARARVRRTRGARWLLGAFNA